jgi:hypothetical protein
MDGESPFISSCSRRELARRRWSRSLVRYQLMMSLLIVALGTTAFLAGRGTF